MLWLAGRFMAGPSGGVALAGLFLSCGGPSLPAKLRISAQSEGSVPGPGRAHFGNFGVATFWVGRCFSRGGGSSCSSASSSSLGKRPSN